MHADKEKQWKCYRVERKFEFQLGFEQGFSLHDVLTKHSATGRDSGTGVECIRHMYR